MLVWVASEGLPSSPRSNMVEIAPATLGGGLTNRRRCYLLPEGASSISYQKVFSLPIANLPFVTGSVLPVRRP